MRAILDKNTRDVENKLINLISHLKKANQQESRAFISFHFGVLFLFNTIYT